MSHDFIVFSAITNSSHINGLLDEEEYRESSWEIISFITLTPLGGKYWLKKFNLLHTTFQFAFIGDHWGETLELE